MREVRPLVTSWLVVALILPSLLALVPAAKANTLQDLLQQSDLQLCAQLGHLPDDQGQAPAGHDHHDGSCCLPSLTGHSALPPQEAALPPAAVWQARKLVLVAFTARLAARQPFGLALARAPPAHPAI